MSSRARHMFTQPDPPLVRFEPAFFSKEELRYFLEHAGESPMVALHTAPPPHVNPVAVEKVLGRLYQLEELRKARGVEWKGFAAFKDSIERYLVWTDRSEYIAQRTKSVERPNGLKHASMFEWDGMGKPHKGGTGADGTFVRSSLTADGTRREFGVNLVESPDFAATLEGVTLSDLLPTKPKELFRVLLEDWTKGILGCPICNFTINFKPKQRQTYNAARMRMAQHLKRAKEETDRHRILWSSVFDK